MANRGRNVVAEIVRDAGGTIVGRTRIQKIVYLLWLTGQLDFDFDFEYRYYGPYSEILNDDLRAADAFDLITEEEHIAQWGGRYSIYKANQRKLGQAAENDRAKFIKAAAAIDPIALELAATAAYLSEAEKCQSPWEETQRRKPEKATTEWLNKAKEAYKRLLELTTPQPLPRIV